MSNLVNGIATASKLLYTTRPLHVRGRRTFVEVILEEVQALEQELRAAELVFEYTHCLARQLPS